MRRRWYAAKVALSIAAALTGLAAHGQVRPMDDIAPCTPALGVDDITAQLFPDNSVLFTAPNARMSCNASPDPLQVMPCYYCLSWQLMVWLGGNVWQVMTPPYPMTQSMQMPCGYGAAQDIVNATNCLEIGAYQMQFQLRGVASGCDCWDEPGHCPGGGVGAFRLFNFPIKTSAP
jgi:hypothetical protein